VNEDQQTQLLIEIRNIQREHLEEYRKAAAESLAIQRAVADVQKEAVRDQKQALRMGESLGRLYRVVVSICGIIAVLLGLAWALSAPRG
jgi:hypothetical protein